MPQKVSAATATVTTTNETWTPPEGLACGGCKEKSTLLGSPTPCRRWLLRYHVPVLRSNPIGLYNRVHGHSTELGAGASWVLLRASLPVAGQLLPSSELNSTVEKRPRVPSWAG